MIFRAILITLLLPTHLLAWDQPARGTDLRGDLMDAVRPHAEWAFGAPVVFVVRDLRVSGEYAFGMLSAVRPDGATLGFDDLQPQMQTWYERDFWDGPEFQVLYQRSGNTWVAVHHALGATDAWWTDPAFCPSWGRVLSEVCN